MAQQRNRQNSISPAQARARAKSRTLLVFYCLLFVGVIVGAVLLCIFMFFKVGKVNINSTTVYSGQELVASTGIKNGDNLIFLNTGKVEAGLLAAFPYLEQARVKKKLPTTVEIQVTEAVAAYAVETGGGYIYVSQTGKILETASAPATGSVVVKAGEVGQKNGYLSLATAELQSIFDEILAVFKARGTPKIGQMDLTNIHKISLVYDGRITFVLGNATDLTDKIVFGLRMIDRGEIGPEASGVLDLSHAKSANRAYFSQTVVTTHKEEDTPAPDTTTEGDAPATGADTPDNPPVEADTPPTEADPPAQESTRGQDIPDV